MKKIFLSPLLALIVSACNNSSTGSKQLNVVDTTKMQMIDTTKLAKGVVFYQCPMHHEIISDKPGSCPKCGMDLEKVKKE